MHTNITERSTARYLDPAEFCVIGNTKLLAFHPLLEDAAPIACWCGIAHTLDIKDRRSTDHLAGQSRTSDDV